MPLLKKIPQILIFFLVLSFALPLLANAQLQMLNETGVAIYGAPEAQRMGESAFLGTTAGKIITIALSLLGIILIILILYGGFLWMTAGGNEEKIGKAKKILGNAIIGLIIIILAYSISFFVIKELSEKVGAPLPPASSSPPG